MHCLTICTDLNGVDLHTYQMRLIYHMDEVDISHETNCKQLEIEPECYRNYKGTL